MSKTNDRWSALSMKDRAALIDIYVKSGIIDLGEIRKDYNSFGVGGDLLKAGASFIPVVGTVIDGIDLIKDPSWENAAYFAGSLASDVLGLTAIKGLAKTSKAFKAAKALAETEKAAAAAKYAKLASKTKSIDKLNNAKKSARAAGDRGRAYYDNLIAKRRLQEAKLAADNAEAKFKIASGVNLFYDTVSQGVQTLEPYVQHHNGGKINKFEIGGHTENTKMDTNWKSNYKDLPQGYKQSILKIVTDLNLNPEDVESLYNSGKLKTVIEAKYQNAPSGRVRQNDSPTSTESSNLEKKMNKMLYNSTDRVLPNMKYAIPYIEELEVKVPGIGRTTTNALDSLAKYAVQAQIPLSEALGLSAQETAFGALPQYNYVEVVGTEEEKQKARDFNRALGNSSYFRNYGIIPAENFVRDFRYNIIEDPIDRDIPPLLHAFNYWKKGNYNRGDSNHTKDVKAKGEAVMKTKVIQDWINSSKFAQKALNLSK